MHARVMLWCLLVGLWCTALAGSQPATQPVVGTIIQADAAQRQLQVQYGGHSQAISVPAAARIMLAGRPTSFDALGPGAHVRLQLEPGTSTALAVWVLGPDYQSSWQPAEPTAPGNVLVGTVTAVGAGRLDVQAPTGPVSVVVPPAARVLRAGAPVPLAGVRVGDGVQVRLTQAYDWAHALPPTQVTATQVAVLATPLPAIEPPYPTEPFEGTVTAALLQSGLIMVSTPGGSYAVVTGDAPITFAGRPIGFLDLAPGDLVWVQPLPRYRYYPAPAPTLGAPTVSVRAVELLGRPVTGQFVVTGQVTGWRQASGRFQMGRFQVQVSPQTAFYQDNQPVTPDRLAEQAWVMVTGTRTGHSLQATRVDLLGVQPPRRPPPLIEPVPYFRPGGACPTVE